MTGASGFFVALARHGREHGGGELLRWDSERETAAFLYSFRAGLDSSPNPDGLGIWAQDGRDIAFLLEYDAGTEHLPQLTGKLPGYAEHARHNSAFTMPILFCFPTARRERTARTALAAARASRDLQIATAALDPRVTCPACTRAWMPLHGGHGPMRLIDLGDVLPDPWQAARENAERQQNLPGNRGDDDDDDLMPDVQEPQGGGSGSRGLGKGGELKRLVLCARLSVPPASQTASRETNPEGRSCGFSSVASARRRRWFRGAVRRLTAGTPGALTRW
jgi:hypothetical protein